MIAVDTNILVYAHRRDAEFHGTADWAVPWPCLHEFFAICTHPKIYHPPSTPAQAIAQIDAWLASPSLSVLGEPAGYWDRLKPILAAGRVTGALVHEARTTAWCVAHGVRELWSADRDFGRFGAEQGRRVASPRMRARRRS